MKKLYSLKFNNPNNAAMSLHTLAEWVRVGDVKLVNSAMLEPRSLMALVEEPEGNIRP